MESIGRRRNRATWLAALAAILLLVWACGSPETRATIVPAGQVRGHILEVTEGEDDKLAGLRLRESSGKAWTFNTEGSVEFSASHTRLHQVLGQTVLVSYLTRGDRLIIVEIID